MRSYRTIPRVCCHCGATFETAPNRICDGGGKYCSQLCAWKAKRLPLEERFWRYVAKGEGCWLWTGAIFTKTGYGQVGIRGKSTGAHRFSWELHFGPIPAGLCVCHHCDIRACVRPDHLFLGTNRDNQLDALAKGRIKTGAASTAYTQPEIVHRGEAIGTSKLTEAQVREIRKRHAEGKPNYPTLAGEYNVHPTVIGRIIRLQLWKHVK